MGVRKKSRKITDASEVLSFWVGDLKDASDFPEGKSRIWFDGGKEVDELIRRRFPSLLEKASRTATPSSEGSRRLKKPSF